MLDQGVELQVLGAEDEWRLFSRSSCQFQMTVLK